MSRMSQGQAQVIDPILSTQARGYTNPDRIWDKLMPRVNIPARSMKVIRFGKESFRRMDTRRAPGSKSKRIEYGYASDPVVLKQEALEATVPIERQQDAQRVPGIDLAAESVNQVLDIFSLNKEYEVATLVRDPAQYDASHVEVLSGSDQWSDIANAKPREVISDACETIRKKIGRKPNTLVMSASVFHVLDDNAAIRERVKYTSSDSVTTALLARYFQVDNIFVGEAVMLGENDPDDAEAADVWGNDAILAYVPKGSHYNVPAYGYMYNLDGYPLVEQPYYENDTKSWVYPTTEEYQAAIVGSDAGFLLRNVVV